MPRTSDEGWQQRNYSSLFFFLGGGVGGGGERGGEVYILEFLCSLFRTRMEVAWKETEGKG